MEYLTAEETKVQFIRLYLSPNKDNSYSKIRVTLQEM